MKLKDINLICDIDGIFCDFVQGFINKANELGLGHEFPSCTAEVTAWMFCDEGVFKTVWDIIKDDELFWSNLPVIKNTQAAFDKLPELHSAVKGYITHRPVSSLITSAWLEKNNFPVREVYTVENTTDKKHVLADHHVDLYIDDYVPTIRDIRAVGLPAVLFAAPYHASEDTSGLPIIKDLTEIPVYLNGGLDGRKS